MPRSCRLPNWPTCWHPTFRSCWLPDRHLGMRATCESASVSDRMSSPKAFSEQRPVCGASHEKRRRTWDKRTGIDDMTATAIETTTIDEPAPLPATGIVIGGSVIETRNLTKRFKGVVALDNLNLEVPPAAIGLLGPNGAG